MTGKPPTLEEVPEKERGGLGLEILKDNDWVDITDKEEVESLMRNEEGNDTDEPQEPDLDMEFEEEVVDDPGRNFSQQMPERVSDTSWSGHPHHPSHQPQPEQASGCGTSPPLSRSDSEAPECEEPKIVGSPSSGLLDLLEVIQKDYPHFCRPVEVTDTPYLSVGTSQPLKFVHHPEEMLKHSWLLPPSGSSLFPSSASIPPLPSSIVTNSDAQPKADLPFVAATSDWESFFRTPLIQDGESELLNHEPKKILNVQFFARLDAHLRAAAMQNSMAFSLLKISEVVFKDMLGDILTSNKPLQAFHEALSQFTASAVSKGALHSAAALAGVRFQMRETLLANQSLPPSLRQFLSRSSFVTPGCFQQVPPEFKTVAGQEKSVPDKQSALLYQKTKEPPSGSPVAGQEKSAPDNQSALLNQKTKEPPSGSPPLKRVKLDDPPIQRMGTAGSGPQTGTSA